MKRNKKTIVITGGAGFIGANMAHAFLKDNYKVIVFERKNADWWRLKEIKKQIIIASPDLLDTKKIETAIKKIKPSVWFNSN